MNFVIFFSYSRQDNEIFQVPRIARELKIYPEIKEVLFYEGVDYANIVKYMNQNIGKCDIFLLFCSQNALNSKYIEDEWQAAYSKDKIIIPIFHNFDHVPPLLTSRLGVQFRRDNIKQSIIDIYNTMIKAYSTPKEAKEEVLKSKKFENLARLKLDWSQYFNDEIIQKIGFRTYEDIKEFLRNPDQWGILINSISQLEKGNDWFKDAFFSIQSGSKGLFQAQYLDHALISVPPPLNLFEQIIDNLERNFVMGLEAPAGWGKSRLLLWIALSFVLQNKATYYFPDPIELNEEIYRTNIQALLQEPNNVIIVDDFHLRSNSPNEISFWRNCFYLARKNHNQILFTLTRVQETQEQMFSPYNFQIISSAEYTQYWKSQWVERFELWFKNLENTILKQYISFQNLNVANKTDSPWGFVSVVVNLRDLITKQLSIKLNANLAIIFTVFVWGYTTSEERGISSKGIYNALLWIKNNSLEQWRELEATGGKLWEFVNANDEGNFLKGMMNQIKKWRQSPMDLTEIRLLPSEGVEIGPNLPIKSHHVAWWEYALEEIWEDEWKDYDSLKQLCKLIILHSSAIINYWIPIDESCKLLEGCAQIEKLYLRNISDIGPLASLKNLRELSLSFTQVSDISPLASLTILKELSLWNTQVSDISPLTSITNLQDLNLSETQVSDINPLSSLIHLKVLSLWGTLVSDLNPLTSLTNLQDLDLRGTKVSVINPLAALTSLEKLTLSDTQVSDITPLASLKNLEKLNLLYTQVSNINSLASLTNLQHLDLGGTKVSDLSPLISLTNLQHLDCRRTKVTDLSPLTSLTNLQDLDLRGTKISDITPLTSLTNLQALNLSETQVSDINPLASLTNLQDLDLNETQVSDISPLASLTNIKVVFLWSTQVSKLSPLTSLANLEVLLLSDTQIFDISSLASLTNLQDLDLRRTKISDISSLIFLKNLRQLQLPDFPFDISKIPKDSPLAQNVNFWVEIGNSSFNSKKYDKAIESYDKALEIDPEKVNVLINKGVSLHYLHNYDEAELCYDKILILDESNGNAWYNKACIESIRNNRGKAIEFLKKAIELDDRWQDSARNDEDFTNIRDLQKFKDLIKEL
ncbi:MAG: leucine-rich repeat domain-containing protein [Promethearchaeota archaeon]